MKIINQRENLLIGSIIFICFFIIASICNAQNKMRKKINCNDQNTNLESIDCYNIKLGQTIEKNWIDTDKIANLDKKLETRVLIKILNNGQVGELKFESKSGNELLDDSVLNAIIKCIPFPQLPKGMNSYNVGLIFTPNGLN